MVLNCCLEFPIFAQNFTGFVEYPCHFTFKPQCKGTVISNKLIIWTRILNLKMHGQNCTHLFQNVLL